MKFPILPEQASELAKEVDLLIWALTGFSALMVLIIVGPMFYFLLKYRRGKKADRRPRRVPELTIEIVWITIPLIMMIGLYAWGADLYFQGRRMPPGAMEINIIGKQWMWKTQHPEGNREINELHVPAGRIVKLTLTSQDVIHSFFLPAFRIKRDVIPGYYTTEWFRANQPGTYHLFCAEYCGAEHSRMVGRVIVMEPEEYQRWLNAGRPENTLVQAGEKLFRELGCSGCHVGSAIVRAPPLDGLYGKPVPLQSGEVVVADEGYIRDSILLPNSQITAGYDRVMQTFQGYVTEEQLLELIAYIKSLGSQTPENAP